MGFVRKHLVVQHLLRRWIRVVHRLLGHRILVLRRAFRNTAHGHDRILVHLAPRPMFLDDRHKVQRAHGIGPIQQEIRS